MNIQNVLGLRMKERRKKLRINQEELAQKVNVARQTVSSWERGDFPPKQDKLMNIASALDTKVGYLLGETDDPSPAPKRKIDLIKGTDLIENDFSLYQPVPSQEDPAEVTYSICSGKQGLAIERKSKDNQMKIESSIEFVQEELESIQQKLKSIWYRLLIDDHGSAFRIETLAPEGEPDSEKDVEK
jgi:transcriptional regulator with XRE-family HTH domain